MNILWVWFSYVGCCSNCYQILEISCNFLFFLIISLLIDHCTLILFTYFQILYMLCCENVAYLIYGFWYQDLVFLHKNCQRLFSLIFLLSKKNYIHEIYLLNPRLLLNLGILLILLIMIFILSLLNIWNIIKILRHL